MSFRAVFTFDLRLTEARPRIRRRGACGEPEVLHSGRPQAQVGQTGCARLRLEWKKSSSPSMRMAGRASPAAKWVKERQQWLGRVRGPDRRQTVGSKLVIFVLRAKP
jgi:hypothetical protein